MSVEAVVLAAGYSSRAGAFKMELEVGGKTLIEHCISGLYTCCDRIYVVGGYRIETVIGILKDYDKVKVVFNKDFERGMFSSVKEGVRHVNTERFFLTPGDYPLISEKVCRNLLDTGGDIIIPMCKGRKGHPILLNGTLAKEISKEPSDSNLREFIKRKSPVMVEVDDEGVLFDIDTIEDYKRLLEHSSW